MRLEPWLIRPQFENSDDCLIELLIVEEKDECSVKLSLRKLQSAREPNSHIMGLGFLLLCW